MDAALRARHADGALEKGADDRTGTGPGSRSCPTSRSSRRSTTTGPFSSSASARWPSSREGLKIDFRDERGERFETSFQYEGGIVDFVKYLHSQGTREPLHPKIVYVEETSDVGEVEVALQWNNSYQEALLSFANNINTHEGGTHLSRLPLGAHPHDQRLRPRRRASSRRRTRTSRARTSARGSRRSSP